MHVYVCILLEPWTLLYSCILVHKNSLKDFAAHMHLIQSERQSQQLEEVIVEVDQGIVFPAITSYSSGTGRVIMKPERLPKLVGNKIDISIIIGFMV